MWTNENRARYDRSRLRYPSDLTDQEWGRLSPLIPPARRGGNRRRVDEREVVNGLMYILSSGCQWRPIPKDLPPRSTLHGYLDLWSWDGTLDRIHYALYVECREHAEHEASPTAGGPPAHDRGTAKRKSAPSPDQNSGTSWKWCPHFASTRQAMVVIVTAFPTCNHTGGPKR